ncbi:UDP-N-acetylmuramate dehydrogenase [Pelagibacterium nitratireducens]|uniref:UDP-N-acetylenolpyruvoylglucosamine reductase n=1 Tax=Pelagibacterium nitratireducens TaxID=1046114 RepID=A0ABZ2I8B9_9HYPH
MTSPFPDLFGVLESTGARITRNADLTPLSRWKIGGRALALVEPSSAKEAASVMAVMSDRPEPLFIVGDASNVLFDSAGFEGVVLRISRAMSQMTISGTSAWAQAGIWMPLFTRRIGCEGLSGIEHTIGIPGTLGGLILMNGGSQRKGVGLNVKSVLCADEAGNLFTLDQEACGFAYRTSTLQTRRAVVLEADLEFEAGNPSEIRSEMISIMASRRAKFPKNLPNCGSTFLSDPAMYATVGAPGKAIEEAGLKGARCNGAQISPLHANFLVNTGGATSDDILYLIALIRQTVQERTGYFMDCEVRHVAPDGRIRPAHEPAEERWGAVDLTKVAGL